MLIRLGWVGPLELTAAEVARIPNGVPGIYMLHTLVRSKGMFATFYVGKASDLKRRLGQHMATTCAKPIISAVRGLHECFWSAAPIEDDQQLAAVESGLIRLLRPLCNSQIPQQPPVLVSLPPLRLTDVLNEENYL